LRVLQVDADVRLMIYREVCFWQSVYSERWIVVIRPRQVKSSVRFIPTNCMKSHSMAPRVADLW
jgi:hypothetical protein